MLMTSVYLDIYSLEKKELLSAQKSRGQVDSCCKLREKYINVVQIPLIAKFLYTIAPGRAGCHISSMLVRIAW